MFDELWGEIRNDDRRNISALGKTEREDLCKLPQIPALEGPKLYQPQPEKITVKREYPTDQLVQNNIALLQYKRQLMSILEALQQNKAANTSGGADGGAGAGLQLDVKDLLHQIPQPPPFPQLAPVKKAVKTNFMEVPAKEEVDVKPTVADIGSSGPGGSSHQTEISRKECLSILRKSVIKISAHSGYTSAMNSALNLLTENAESFILNIASKLRSELDGSLKSNEDGNGWTDILEKVLVESGSGGILQLQEYYDNYVVKYNTRLLAHCRDLDEMYKKEMNLCVDTDNIPEMHFPSSEEGAGESLPNLATPTLDVGMQMLQSLEASVDLGDEPPLSNQSEMAYSVQSCPTPSPAFTPKNCPTPSPAAFTPRNLCPTPSPAYTPRPLPVPSPAQLGAPPTKKRR